MERTIELDQADITLQGVREWSSYIDDRPKLPAELVIVEIDGRFNDEHFIALLNSAETEDSFINVSRFIRSPNKALSDAVKFKCLSFPSDTVRDYQIKKAIKDNSELIKIATKIRAAERKKSSQIFAPPKSLIKDLLIHRYYGPKVQSSGKLTVGLSPCLPDNSFAKKELVSGDTLEEIAKEQTHTPIREYSFEDQRRLLEFNRPLIEKRNSKHNRCDASSIIGLQCASSALQIGDVIALPKKSIKKTITIRKEAAGLVERKIPEGSLKSLLVEEEELLSADIRMQSVSSSSCSTTSVGVNHWDVDLIWDRYRREQAKYGKSPTSAKVGVIDSGLNPSSSKIIKDLFFGQIRGDAISSVKPHDGNPHGTQVTSLVLGGAEFLTKVLDSIKKPDADPPPIQLRFYALNSEGLQDDNDLNSGIKFLSFKRIGSDGKEDENFTPADIINISAAVKGTNSAITDLVSNSEGPLFVVASGNGIPPDEKGKNLQYFSEEELLIPATLGGNNSDTVMTVAAIDMPFQISDFSNYSSELVDIAAPGCNIKVLDYDDSWGYASGTSMAAPLVAFTAGLISSLDNKSRNPRFQKSRISMAADFDLKKPGVRNNAVLNIVRSISLRTDVLQIHEADKEPKFIFGEVLKWNEPDGGPYDLHLGHGLDCSGSPPKRIIVTSDSGSKNVEVYSTWVHKLHGKKIGKVKKDICPGADLSKFNKIIFQPEEVGAAPIILGSLKNFDLMLSSY